MANCIFCKIAEGETNTVLEFENHDLVIFKDIKPVAEHHYLAVPKKHIESLKTLPAGDVDLNQMENCLKEYMISKNVNMNDVLFGFHWPPFTSVNHVHMHGIAPTSQMGFISRWVFRPNTMWFSTADYARQWLKKKAVFATS